MIELVKDQEYYADGEFYTYYGEINSDDEYSKNFAIMRDCEGVLCIQTKERLKLKEDTYEWQRKLQHKKELEELTAEAEKRLDEIADDIVNRALESLATRIRLNAMFGKASNATFALTIVGELEKMVKEKPKEAIKEKLNKKDDPFS